MNTSKIADIKRVFCSLEKLCVVPVFKEWTSLKSCNTYFVREMDINSKIIVNIYETIDIF